MHQPTTDTPLELLRDYCLNCEDPLALVDEDGKLSLINPAMRRRLGDLANGEAQLRAMAPADAPRSCGLQRDDKAGEGSQLLRLPLGRLALITLVERAEDPRVERLRQKLEEAQKQSITDPLTGVWNRLQFQQLSKMELARSARHRQPLCLLVLDIDHFKSVNDSFGHAVGDQVLCELAELIGRQIRLVDCLFRWGGEEFVVLLPNTAMTAARMIAERLRRVIEQHGFQIERTLTVSIGLTQAQAGESATAFFARADQALYTAKENGRNQVVCAGLGSADPAGGGDDSPLFMPWKAEYESGHPLIDTQHQKLFELGNALIAASLDPETEQEDFLGMTDALIDHIGQHFTDEESILEAMGYTELVQHQRAHHKLLVKAKDLRHRAADARVTTGEVIDFLVNGVVRNHMLTADKAFFGQLPAASSGR